jgi:hypothetical protein
MLAVSRRYRPCLAAAACGAAGAWLGAGTIIQSASRSKCFFISRRLLIGLPDFKLTHYLRGASWTETLAPW